MPNNALGMIETYGISPAIAVIDTTVKSVNVVVLPRVMVGGGLVVVLFRDDLSSVPSLWKTVLLLLLRVGKVLSVNVIAGVQSDVLAILMVLSIFIMQTRILNKKKFMRKKL